jgi:hypothetical protein
MRAQGDKVVRDAGASIGHGLCGKSAFGRPQESRTRFANRFHRLRSQGCFPLSGSLSPRDPRTFRPAFAFVSKGPPHEGEAGPAEGRSSAPTGAAVPPLSKTAPPPAPPPPERRPCRSARVAEYRKIFRMLSRGRRRPVCLGERILRNAGSGLVHRKRGRDLTLVDAPCSMSRPSRHRIATNNRGSGSKGKMSHAGVRLV